MNFLNPLNRNPKGRLNNSSPTPAACAAALRCTPLPLWPAAWQRPRWRPATRWPSSTT